MKKLLLFALTVSSFGAYAQTSFGQLNASTVKENNNVVSVPSKARFAKPEKATRATSGYYNWLAFLGAEAQIPTTTLDDNTGLFTMFPDSVVRFNPPNQAFGISYKSLGQIIDPASPIVLNNLVPGDMVIGTGNAYTVDSVFVLGSYVKMNNAVDTLIVSFVHSGLTNNPEFYFTGQGADFGVDTTRFLAQLYPRSTFNTGAYQLNANGGPAAYTVRYPLTNLDSSAYVNGSNSYNLKYIEVSANNFQVPAGEKASVSVTFKPGSPYAAGDSIGKHSRFLFMSCEPNGGANGSFMPFWANDRNMSAIVHKDSTNWGGIYIPTLAWTIGYGPEVHEITWKLSCAECAPLSVNNVNSGIISNVYPNPAQGQLYFDLQLKETAKNLSVEIANTMGQVVKTQNFGSMAKVSGLKMDVSSLPNGVYIYTINADGKKFASKFTISK